MPDELYRRCPACVGPDPAASCPTCGGERYIAAGITLRDVERLAGNRDHGRWRVRISTLMVLVLIAALASFVVVGWWREAEASRRAVALARVLAEARRAEAAAVQAQLAAQPRAQAPNPAPPGPTK